ncbi:MAG: HAD hydrolase-like protein [Caldilineaceae bacterium]
MANILRRRSMRWTWATFAAMMSGAHLPKSKPDPCSSCNPPPISRCRRSRCLVIEDSVHGVEAARRAGMACVVVGCWPPIRRWTRSWPSRLVQAACTRLTVRHDVGAAEELAAVTTV